jgi:hypothetical protein
MLPGRSTTTRPSCCYAQDDPGLTGPPMGAAEAATQALSLAFMRATRAGRAGAGIAAGPEAAVLFARAPARLGGPCWRRCCRSAPAALPGPLDDERAAGSAGAAWPRSPPWPAAPAAGRGGRAWSPACRPPSALASTLLLGYTLTTRWAPGPTPTCCMPATRGGRCAASACATGAAGQRWSSSPTPAPAGGIVPLDKLLQAPAGATLATLMQRRPRSCRARAAGRHGRAPGLGASVGAAGGGARRTPGGRDDTRRAGARPAPRRARRHGRAPMRPVAAGWRCLRPATGRRCRACSARTLACCPGGAGGWGPPHRSCHVHDGDRTAEAADGRLMCCRPHAALTGRFLLDYPHEAARLLEAMPAADAAAAGRRSRRTPVCAPGRRWPADVARGAAPLPARHPGATCWPKPSRWLSVAVLAQLDAAQREAWLQRLSAEVAMNCAACWPTPPTAPGA